MSHLLNCRQRAFGDSESNREQSFALEKHLEEFIVSNFHRVFNGKLEISGIVKGLLASSTGRT